VNTTYLLRAALLFVGIALPWLGFSPFAVVSLLFVWLIAFLVWGKSGAGSRRALMTAAFLLIGLVFGVAFSLIAFISGPA